MPGILGRKIGMTRIFEDNGNVIPLTIVQCAPNTVTQVKTIEKDGYPAVVLGFETLKKPKKTRKFRFLREFPIQEGETLNTGDQVTVEKFKDVKEVVITGVSKGKGFQGTIKRWHFSSGPRSHGSHFNREPGSIGPRARMGKLHKGKKLAGHMGFERITRKCVPIVKVDVEKNLIAVKGPVPGPNGTLVIIKT